MIFWFCLVFFFFNKRLLNKPPKTLTVTRVCFGLGCLVFSLNNFPLKFLIFPVLLLKFSGEMLE